MDYCSNRQAVRYQGEIPLKIKQGMGFTRNFSTSGLYFVTDQPVSMGEHLELVMLLEHQTQGLRVRCLADVVRVEQNSGKSCVAVTITKHLFELAPEMAAAYVESVMGSSIDLDDKSEKYN